MEMNTPQFVLLYMLPPDFGARLPAGQPHRSVRLTAPVRPREGNQG